MSGNSAEITVIENCCDIYFYESIDIPKDSIKYPKKWIIKRLSVEELKQEFDTNSVCDRQVLSHEYSVETLDNAIGFGCVKFKKEFIKLQVSKQQKGYGSVSKFLLMLQTLFNNYYSTRYETLGVFILSGSAFVKSNGDYAANLIKCSENYCSENVKDILKDMHNMVAIDILCSNNKFYKNVGVIMMYSIYDFSSLNMVDGIALESVNEAEAFYKKFGFYRIEDERHLYGVAHNNNTGVTPMILKINEFKFFTRDKERQRTSRLNEGSPYTEPKTRARRGGKRKTAKKRI